MKASEASNIPISQMPDHVLYRAVGNGACGEVWLAKNLLGRHRAKRKLSEFLKTIGRDRDGGIHLLEQVRERFKDVPAVFCTRKGTVEDVAVCLAAGARDVIPKPQPEQMDASRELYPQLMEAAIAHRSSLLAKFESLISARCFFGKLTRLVQFQSSQGLRSTRSRLQKDDKGGRPTRVRSCRLGPIPLKMLPCWMIPPRRTN